MHDPVTDLEKLVTDFHPDDVLLFAPREHPFSRRLRVVGDYKVQDASILVNCQPDRRYPLAIVVGYLDSRPQENIEALIAALRDVYAERLYCLANPMEWPAAKMVSLGLSFIRTYPPNPGVLDLYHFDIHHYKRTPDWLNANHWAHPERWDKERW